jgi:uncharacterized protein
MSEPTRTRGGTCAIAVMAKTPQPGRSKTRLCPPLRPEQAAALSAAFLRDVTENLREAGRQASIARYAAYAPIGTESALYDHLAPGTRLIPADGSVPMAPGVEGFGRCLLQAIQALLAEGHDAACVLSSDAPTLPTQCLVQAARASLAPTGSAAGRVVLGACDDGGYYLLGMSAAHAGLFTDIAWSTEGVADATRARARALSLDLVELAPWYDVDDADSLTMLMDETAGYAAPATRDAIARLGLRAALAPQAS